MQRIGGRLVAIAVDDEKESAGVVQRDDLPFPILCDTQREVVRQYRVVHVRGGPGGGDIAIPAHFLIAPTGKVVWEHVARRIQDRPYPSEIIKAIQALPRKGA